MAKTSRSLLHLAAFALLLGTIGVARATAASVDGIPLHWTSAGAGPQTLMLVHGWT